MKRLIAICLCAVLLAGCSVGEKAYTPTGSAFSDEPDNAAAIGQEEGQAEQELCLVYYPDISLNPLVCTDYTNRALFSLVYQGLFAVDRDYNVVPILCKNFSVSEDMKTYTFYLADATFSDGTALTAEDVVASLQAAAASQYYGKRLNSLYFADISASDSGSVTIRLTSAFENLPILLDIPIVKASEVEAERPLGTGPYAFESTVSGLRLRRRSNWWCQSGDFAVTASAITLLEAESTVQIRDEFEFADVGLVCTDPNSDNYADYRCDAELWDCENGMFLYLGFNCNSNTETIFTDSEVRAAVTYAIDRDTLAKEYYGGYAWSAALPASPQSPYYSSSLASHYGYDPEKFAEVIERKGLQGKTIRLLVSTGDSVRRRVAKAIAAMLEDGGLTVEITECSTSQMTTYLRACNYDLYLAQTKLSPNMDLSPFFYVYGSLSYGAMSSEVMLSLCRSALENQGNYYNLHKAVMDEGWLCPILFQEYAIFVTRGLITGLNPARDNVFYYTIGLTMQDIQVAAEEE